MCQAQGQMRHCTSVAMQTTEVRVQGSTEPWGPPACPPPPSTSHVPKATTEDSQ